MRSIVFILCLASLVCFGQGKKEESASINKIVAKIDELSQAGDKAFSKDIVVDQKNVKEKWRVFENNEYSRIIIQYTTDSAGHSIAYTEKYYLRNGALIYAYESEVFFETGQNMKEGIMWNGDFYFSKGKLIEHVTNGHGRSELDDWDPEKEILQKWKKRKEELSK